MLSLKYHILFWTISILTIPVALLRHRLRAYLPSILAEPLLENIIHGLIVYMIWKKKKKLYWMYWVYLASLGALCVASDEVVLEMGFVGKMPENHEFDEDGIRMLVAHGLTSFLVLGTLEPIMRDRRDIEVYGMGILSEYPMLRGRGQNPIWATIMGLMSLAAVTSLIELALYRILGQ
ncbi:hypothetical protein BKA56DRAFT_664574 [Ilyonectria sp. MPI-CAGE-AT-0026]|nr:hypothetical protein BKA56DRAFT_664574 [Ilyonectria sp. MPI-CAGE-AT-0026]